MGKKIKIKIKKPWIGYCGSPIQQNYAEDLNHGYLLWDITNATTWDVNFKNLPNPSPYVTLNWTGSINNLIKSAEIYPNGTRFRICSSTLLGQNDFKIIGESLKNLKHAAEVTFKSDFIDKSVIKTETSMITKANLRNLDVLLKLIKDYYRGTYISDELWLEVIEQVKICLFNATLIEETTRNSKWSLRYLGFDNMFSYGSNNVINFDKLNGIVGIFGTNRIGKSSIIGTLMYALFNATDRGPIKNIHICNIRKPYCFSRVIINHDGTDFIIERQTTKTENKKGIISASTSLNIFKIGINGEAEDLGGEQRIDTEKVIRSLIGNQEDFTLTSLASQGEINQFISQGSTKRRLILSRFLDLDIFDRMFDISNKELSLLKAQLKNRYDSSRDWYVESEKIKKEIEETNVEITNSTQKNKDNQFKLSLLQHELSLHKDVTPITKLQVESFKKNIENLEKQFQLCNNEIIHFENQIIDFTKKIKIINEVKLENDINKLRLDYNAYKDLESLITTLCHSYDKELTLTKQHQKSLKTLNEVPCGDLFLNCKFIKDAHLNKDKLKDQLSKVDNIQNQLTTTKAIFKNLQNENIINRLEKLEKLLELETKITLDNSRKETELAKIKSSYYNKSNELVVMKERLLMMEEALKNKENAEIVSIKLEIENLFRATDKLATENLLIATRKGRLIATLEKLDEEKSFCDSLLKKMKVHELVTMSFSKRGIPLIITKLQLPIINMEIEKILQGIVDFTVELENDEGSDSSEIYINYGDSRRIIELCSGMEKTIASIAVRVAMINASLLPKPDIFIIDEGFGTLDDTSIEACNRLLVSIKKYFRTVIIITHIDSVKDIADHVLNITKNEKDSMISFGVDK